MARIFLYIVALLIALAVGGAVAWNYWQREISQFVFVPRGEFIEQKPLAASIYEDPEMWLSRPGMGPKNPAMWVPPGWVEDADASTAAVFFIHPTSYLAREHWNAPLEDAEANERAQLFLRGMATPFNKSVNLWAPRYRQAAFGAFLTDAPAAQKAIDAAYADVLAAFDYFVETIDDDAPIVLAGHSQGSLHLMRLLKERVAGTPLADRVVAAYPIGWPISIEHDLPAMGLPACATAGQPGCIASWSSFAEPADPSAVLDSYAASIGFDGRARGSSPVLCVNPLTGGIGGEAPASTNLGTLVPDESLADGTIVPGLVPARCDERGLLLIGPPPEMGSAVLPGNNYHVYDIPLFWANLRRDVAQRQQAWAKAR